MSKAITPEPQDRQERPGLGSPIPEVAPSRLREDDLNLPRTFGMSGAVLVLAGTVALIAHLSGRTLFTVSVNPGWAVVLTVLGMCGLLYHAAFDRDVMFRRLYQMFALVLLAVGAVLCLIQYPKAMGDQLRFGAPCLMLALLFLVAAIRNETDDNFRKMMESIFGAAGALFAMGGLLGGSLRGDFLLPVGIVLALFGLVYLSAFVSSRGISDDQAFYAAVGMVGLGILVVLIALGRTFFAANGTVYFTGHGIMLVALGLAYAIAGGGAASDLPFLVQLRRELGAFFFSPVTYFVLFGFAIVWFPAWLSFVDDLADSQGSTLEPIVRNYLFSLFPVIMIIFAAPVLTMNLFAEENRSGTMEVLLTAPVTEASVVFSKFLAALIVYMICWAPAGMYLLAIPLAGGKAFDYRPLLSFFVAVLCSGAAFVSMGLFFSSLTRSMLVAVVLSIAGMFILTFLYFPSRMRSGPNEWSAILTHMSYLDLYMDSLEGKVTPRFLIFPLSMTLFFLFLTLKVVESRKWR